MAALVSAAHIGFWPGKTPRQPTPFPSSFRVPPLASLASRPHRHPGPASATHPWLRRPSAALACSAAGWLRGSVRQRPAAGRLHGWTPYTAARQAPRRRRPGHLATQSSEPRRRRAETGAGDGASGGWLEPPLPPMLMCTMCLFLCAR
jgi:hypothetical protein